MRCGECMWRCGVRISVILCCAGGLLVVCVCVCVCVCAPVCVCVCVCSCVCASVCVYACVCSCVCGGGGGAPVCVCSVFARISVILCCGGGLLCSVAFRKEVVIGLARSNTLSSVPKGGICALLRCPNHLCLLQMSGVDSLTLYA